MSEVWDAARSVQAYVLPSSPILAAYLAVPSSSAFGRIALAASD
jgi:hypothetical protein